jgi:hypothetical protein
MTPAERKEGLNRLMRERNMTARQVGALVGAAPKTVRNWRSSVDRDIPAQAWELLRLKIGAGQGA